MIEKVSEYVKKLPFTVDNWHCDGDSVYCTIHKDGELVGGLCREHCDTYWTVRKYKKVTSRYLLGHTTTVPDGELRADSLEIAFDIFK